MREELELSNLANLYVREVIKKQCWEEMVVKGKVLKVLYVTLGHAVCDTVCGVWVGGCTCGCGWVGVCVGVSECTYSRASL